MFKNIQYNLSLNYRKSTRNLKTANVIQGIDNILTPILLDAVDESVNVRGSLKKGYGKIKLSAKTNLSFSNEKPVIEPLDLQTIQAAITKLTSRRLKLAPIN